MIEMAPLGPERRRIVLPGVPETVPDDMPETAPATPEREPVPA